MEIKQKLMNQFPDIVDVNLEIENNQKFLRVKTRLKLLPQIEALTSQISTFLDEIDYSESHYYLDVFSSGAELDASELSSLD